jgi:hypothetical protein
VQTPAAIDNRPGLPAVAYRVGTWASFKESMLARLSSSDYPALAGRDDDDPTKALSGLKTRDDDDPTIALLDATAVVLDILTFYQERLANESYLRTAGQQRSLVELSRLIGYRPTPGVAAATYVAFTLKTTPGQTPDPNALPITIPAGTQLQSVPAQGETPQTFETSADVQAKADWNALPVLSGEAWAPKIGDTSLWLEGTSTQLQPGDRVLIVGDVRKGDATSTAWTLCEVIKVEADGTNNVTYVEWKVVWNDSVVDPGEHPEFHAFRQRGALFGYNALDTALLPSTTTISKGQDGDWLFELPDDYLVDLDALYGKVTSGSWIVLSKPARKALVLSTAIHFRAESGIGGSPTGDIGEAPVDAFKGSPATTNLYGVKSVAAISRSAYAVSAKITRATVDDNTNLDDYYKRTRDTSALVQSEALAVVLQPLSQPLYGPSLELRDLRVDLAGIGAVAVSGKRQKVGLKVVATLIPDDGSEPFDLDVDAVVTITGGAPLVSVAPSDWTTSAAVLTLNVEDDAGRPGTIAIALENLRLEPSGDKDPVYSEYALVSSVDNGGDHTVLSLDPPLVNCYERSKTTTVNANVVTATHGQTVSEILGSGSAATPNQAFTLKQSPLTYVQAPTPTGRESTLTVRVSGVEWKEVATLYGQKPSASVFTTIRESETATDVLFGDGVEGSTLPTGQSNLQAEYRIGSGAAGNVVAGTLTTLVDRPLGVSGVTNPQAATGGEDAESIDDIRINAPQTVLTLGRAVSIADYQSYASTFSGVSKAHALWIPSGPGRGVFVTVAGTDGQALPENSKTLGNLVTSLENFGNPLIPIRVRSFLETLFKFSADVRYDPAYEPEAVQAEIEATVTKTYGFANRSFGQGVSVDGIAEVIQAVPGVVAVNVKELTLGDTSSAGDLAGPDGTFTVPERNAWLAQKLSLQRPFSGSPTRICAYLPVPSLTALPQPAEILVLDRDPHAIAWGVLK